MVLLKMDGHDLQRYLEKCKNQESHRRGEIVLLTSSSRSVRECFDESKGWFEKKVEGGVIEFEARTC